MKRLNLLLFASLSGISTMAAAAAPDTEAVEFYNAFTQHYFVTATASEARLIDDGGAGEGWMRTGRSFQAWLKKDEAPANAQPVCRFYSFGANSHFYTASGGECEALRSAEAAERSRGTVRGWQYEGIAFYIQGPSAGSCPAGTAELLRVYNNGFNNGQGSNHRFIDDSGLQELMVESKWIAEGAVFCAAPKSTGTNANLRPTTTSFEALAGTWKGDAKWEVESGGRETETTQALALTLAADGNLTGTGFGCSFAGKVAVGDGFRSFFSGSVTATGCTNTAFNGQYPRVRLQRFGANTLMVKMKRGDDANEASISARLTNGTASPAGQPAGPASVAGEWTGTVGWEAEGRGIEVESNRLLNLTISTTGTVTGNGFGCTFTGTLAAASGSSSELRGELTAAGCENALFNGRFTEVRVKREGSGVIKVEFKREADGVEVEIEGLLHAKEAGTTPPPVPAPDPVVVGKWEGSASWSAGTASGTDRIAFTIGANGAFSGAGFGCTLSGSLKLAMGGRVVTGGTVTASGCSREALNVSFTSVEFEREGANSLEFEFEREVGGSKVKVKGRVARVAG